MGIVYPVWETLPNLGTFAQNYSFDLHPIQIFFGADTNTTVSIINGAIPAGLRYVVINNVISIYGAAIESSSEIVGQFTFRLVQTNGYVADRTFTLTLTPLLVNPSWEGQQTFLGYQNKTTAVSYLLTATTTTGDHLRYDLPLSPVYAIINSKSGLLTCNASTITVNTTLNILVRATDITTGANSVITVSIGVLVAATPPIWITPAGTITGTYYGKNYVEFNLQAEDPYATTVAYSLVSYSTGFPLYVAASGLLYGALPDVLEDIIYTFTVSAISINGTTSRTFALLVQPAILNAQFAWNTSSDLGYITEGQYITVAIKATSTRNNTIVYNVTGGLLPPHLMLGSTNGLIVGFCEYTAIKKTYYFDVTAYDGYEYLVQQFGITVNKIYSNQFFNAYIPVTGALRDQWDTNTSNIRIREPGTVIFDTVTNIPNPPTMNIIDGLVTDYATPEQILDVINPWWHELDLRIGMAANTAALSDGFSTLYYNITDLQSGSNARITDSHVQGGVVYPISINNMRKALMKEYPYVSSGSGYGFAMLPMLDYSIGSIQSVLVLDTGYGYLSPPVIVVGGAGTGAVLQPILGLVGVSVDTSSIGWFVGNTFAIPGGDPTVAAIVTVTETNAQGYMVSAEVTLSGSYIDVGTVNSVPITYGTANATLTFTWGIVAVEVVASGTGYNCGITINVNGGEILPPWQTTYFPAIASGEISPVTSALAANVLNTGTDTLWGMPWQPTIMIMQWQGIRWLGNTTFDNNKTTWDGNSTRFQDTQGPLETVFDNNTEIFDNGQTIFDWQDPLSYDLFQVWGSTLIDAGTTVFDLYSTIFDTLAPRTYSNTRLRKWVTTQNKIYSGNNAVY